MGGEMLSFCSRRQNVEMRPAHSGALLASTVLASEQQQCCGFVWLLRIKKQLMRAWAWTISDLGPGRAVERLQALPTLEKRDTCCWLWEHVPLQAFAASRTNGKSPATRHHPSLFITWVGPCPSPACRIMAPELLGRRPYGLNCDIWPGSLS